MSDKASVNTDHWNANSVVLIESTLSKLHRKAILNRSRFTELAGKEMRIMDMGCGSGPFLAYFWSQGYRNLAAIEPDPELTKNIPSHIKVDVRHCLAEHIDFPDESFDVVFVYGVLHHLKGIESYRAACAELYRILKPGGMIFIMEPGRYRLFVALEIVAGMLGLVSKTFRAFAETMRQERPEQHFFLKNHDAVRQCLLGKGLKALKDDYFLYSWLFTARKPF